MLVLPYPISYFLDSELMVDCDNSQPNVEGQLEEHECNNKVSWFFKLHLIKGNIYSEIKNESNFGSTIIKAVC